MSVIHINHVESHRVRMPQFEALPSIDKHGGFVVLYILESYILH